MTRTRLFLAVILAGTLAMLVAGQDPCIVHTVLNDPTRSMEYVEDVVLCDQHVGGIVAGWHRFQIDGYDAEMSTTCIPKHRCRTHAPTWIDLEGQILPQSPGQEVVAKACSHWYEDCCFWNTGITIRNCGSYFVYYLNRPPICSLRYCFVPPPEEIATVTCTRTDMVITMTKPSVPQNGVFIQDYTEPQCLFTKTVHDHHAVIPLRQCGMAEFEEDGKDVFTLTVKTMSYYPASFYDDKYYNIKCSFAQGVESTFGVITVTNEGDLDPELISDESITTVTMEIVDAEGNPAVQAEVGDIMVIHLTVNQDNGFPGCTAVEKLLAYYCTPGEVGCEEEDAYELWIDPPCGTQPERVVITDGPVPSWGCLAHSIPMYAFTLQNSAGSEAFVISFVAVVATCLEDSCELDCGARRRRREAIEEDWTVVSGERRRRQTTSTSTQGNSTNAIGKLIVTHKNPAADTVKNTGEDVNLKNCFTDSGVQVLIACMATLIGVLIIALIVFALGCCHRHRNGKEVEEVRDEKRERKERGSGTEMEPPKDY